MPVEVEQIVNSTVRCFDCMDTGISEQAITDEHGGVIDWRTRDCHCQADYLEAVR